MNTLLSLLTASTGSEITEEPAQTMTTPYLYRIREAVQADVQKETHRTREILYLD